MAGKGWGADAMLSSLSGNTSGLTYFGMEDKRQGIVHVIGPEQAAFRHLEGKERFVGASLARIIDPNTSRFNPAMLDKAKTGLSLNYKRHFS